MLRIRETIVVEGKYDRIKLASIVDANIITTDGFRIFKDKEKLSLLRKIAETRGIIALLDPDRAGGVIRGFLKSALPGDKIKFIYIPGIAGKEKRKTAHGADGLLGVEGVDSSVIVTALEKFGVTEKTERKAEREITRLDLYERGFAGGVGSLAKRQALCRALDLPQLAVPSLLAALNILFNFEEWLDKIENI